jgi:hypothetical protein
VADLLGDVAVGDRHETDVHPDHLGLPDLAAVRVRHVFSPGRVGLGHLAVPVEQPGPHGIRRDLAQGLADELLDGTAGELRADLVEVLIHKVGDLPRPVADGTKQEKPVERPVEYLVQQRALLRLRRDGQLAEVGEARHEPVARGHDQHLEVTGDAGPVVVHRARHRDAGLHDLGVERHRPVVDGLRPQLPVPAADEVVAGPSEEPATGLVQVHQLEVDDHATLAHRPGDRPRLGVALQHSDQVRRREAFVRRYHHNRSVARPQA